MLESLKSLYVALGGALTDTYEGIAGGAPVSDYFLTTDVILACAQVAGGGGASDFVISVTMDATSGTPAFTSETDIDDILAAHEAGKNIKVNITGEGFPDMFGYIVYVVGGNDAAAGFLIYGSDVGLLECNGNGWSTSN